MRTCKTILALLLCSILLLTGCTPVSSPSGSGETTVTRTYEDPISGATASTEDPVNDTATTVSTEASDFETTADTEPAATAITTPAPAVPADSFFEIHFIDVGQADAALILCDGDAALFDGGNAEDSSLIYSYLKEHGINHLSTILCSHGHEDHVGGLAGALNYATVDTALCSVTDYDSKAFQNFVKYLDAQEKQITVPAPGDVFYIGSATATILGPLSDSDEPNNTSLVLKVQYGSTSFLFTGDAELDEETEILDAGYDISCDVLKVGHHGSSTSTGYRWLREANPEYAVISVGEDNSYGHPTEETLSRLRDADVTVYRTDLQGHIICSSDGTNVSFQVARNADADTLSGAGAGGNHNSDPVPAETDTLTAASTENTPDETKNPVTEPPVETEVPPSSSGSKYVCNTNSKKFHYADCSSVDQMADHNKWETDTPREDLIAQGYDPCGRCDP